MTQAATPGERCYLCSAGVRAKGRLGIAWSCCGVAGTADAGAAGGSGRARRLRRGGAQASLAATRRTELYALRRLLPCRRKLLCFPRGNGRSEALSLYLMAAETEDLPFGWARMATFRLMLVNHRDHSQSVQKGEPAAGQRSAAARQQAGAGRARGWG